MPNRRTVTACNAFSVSKDHIRAEHDYYATPPEAVRLMMGAERFGSVIWEPACGDGAISRVLVGGGYKVISSDIVDRGYGDVADFFQCDTLPDAGADIITNPPYSCAKEFIEHSLDLLRDGGKAAFLLRLQFLEGIGRRQLFDKTPPRRVLVHSARVNCLKNGDPQQSAQSAVAYAWFVWEKGYTGAPEIAWL